MLPRDAAQALTDKITSELDVLYDDIINAFTQDAHTALDKKWEDYVAPFPKLNLPAAKRKGVANRMTAAGMKQIEIAQAIGCSAATVSLDLSGGRIPAPERPTGKYSQKCTETYRQIVTGHPVYGVEQIARQLSNIHPSLKFNAIDVRRLKMLSEAPAEFRDNYFAGKINFATVRAILDHQVAEHVSDDAKVTVLRKVMAGLTGGSSGARIRAVMDLIPQIHGTLKQQWMDKSRGMTFDELLAANLQATAQINRGVEDEREWRIRNTPSYSYSLHTPKLIERLRATLEQVRKELPSLVRLTFETDDLGQALRELGRELYDIGELVVNKGETPAERPAPNDTPVRVFEGLGDSDYVNGYAVIDG